MKALSKLNQLYLKFRVFLLLGLLFIILPFYGFLNIKLILISLFSICIFIFDLLSSDKKVNRISPIFLICIAFLILTFTSCLWSINIPEAIHSSMNWMLVFLFAYAVSKLDFDKDYLSNLFRCIQFIFIVLLVQNFFAVFLSDNIGSGWNNLLSFNQNYTASLLVLLSPFVICDNRINKFVRLLSFVLCLAVLFFVGSRGSLLAYLVFIFSYIVGLFSKSISIILFILFLLGGIVFLMNYFTFDGELSRIELIRNSINLWKEHPLIGSGAGSWNIEILKYGLDYDDILGSNIKTTKTVLSHNMPFKILAELGVVGFLLFSTIMLYPIMFLLKSRRTTSFNNGALYSSLLFIFFSNIYTFCNLNKFDFSGHIIFFFLLIGIISSSDSDD